MLAYTLMLAATSTGAYASVFVGLFLLMLPISLSRAGGWAGMGARLDAEFFDVGGIALAAPRRVGP
ncbi:hypothetical protein [Micrococcus flavus]|uniref:Uncharacterized protein n=1 Tax=Micrococcus flavus TaxID=384602 RepID=A0A7W7L4D9_9MICC|nr:hypothetical protein [Micrococcus flavus]GGK40297.1 hypothetical protein GCM10007073_03860 [Micrococcus flavus]